jgi:hypothetical protein
VLHIYAAPRRFRYIFSFFGLVDLLSILPFYTGFLGTQYLRALRLVRLFRLAEIEAAGAVDTQDVMEEGIGLAEGEHVEYVITRHPIYLFLGSVTPIIATTFGITVLLAFEMNAITLSLAVALFLFAIIFLWKAWLDYSYDVIYLTPYRLIFHNQHLLGRSINQVSYPAITNVKPFYPGPISFIFKYGSLVIDTAAEHPGQIEMHMVSRHEKAAHEIMRRGLARSIPQTQSGFSPQSAPSVVPSSVPPSQPSSPPPPPPSNPAAPTMG